MKKKESEELIDKLIAGKIRKDEFQRILDSIEDPEEAIFIENSLKRRFLAHINTEVKERKPKSKKGEQE
ncbi:hypothetical protein [Pleomorphovibrio marinus]|uniref:hypothetical protein n=1 Tax=Pleomorphovibrio marinus TaxID=2164132 RepID=UPI00130067F8|nr:hypothetical protein [Pleomorphovibrio marinus]